MHARALMLQRSFLFILLSVALLCPVALCLSDQALQPSLHGAVSLWEPYQFLKDDGGTNVLAGFDVELTREILAGLDYKVEFQQILDKARHLEGIENGTLDFTTSPRFPDRERYAWFSAPLRREINVLYVRPPEARAFQFETVAHMVDLFRRRSIRLGLVRGREYGPAALSHFISEGRENGSVIELEKTDDLIRALTEQRIDAFLLDRLVGETVARRMDKQALLQSVPLPPECSADICLMFSKKTVSPELVSRIDQRIAALKATPRYGQIVRFWVFPVLLSITVNKPWFLAMDFIGTLAFAISGTLLARRERYSLIGAFVMASLPTVGGGVVRDLIVQRQPLGILRTPSYLFIIIAVIGVGFVISKLLDRFKPDPRGAGSNARAGLHSGTAYALQVCDAVGLAAFLIVGVVVAVETRAVPILLWGPIFAMLTGCGGGILRDVVRADAGNPMLKTSFYGEVALIWGFLFSVFLRWETWRLDPLEVQIAVLVTFLGAFVMRMTIVHLQSNSPSF